MKNFKVGDLVMVNDWYETVTDEVDNDRENAGVTRVGVDPQLLSTLEKNSNTIFRIKSVDEDGDFKIVEEFPEIDTNTVCQEVLIPYDSESTSTKQEVNSKLSLVSLSSSQAEEVFGYDYIARDQTSQILPGGFIDDIENMFVMDDSEYSDTDGLTEYITNTEHSESTASYETFGVLDGVFTQVQTPTNVKEMIEIKNSHEKTYVIERCVGSVTFFIVA